MFEMTASEIIEEEGFEHEHEISETSHLVARSENRYQLMLIEGVDCWVGKIIDRTKSTTAYPTEGPVTSASIVVAGQTQLDLDPREVSAPDMSECIRRTLRTVKELRG